MKRHEQSDERGVALIAALGTLALMLLLTATIIAVSQTMRYRTATVTQLGDSIFRAESAANLTLWLLANDKSNFTDRNPTPVREFHDTERYLANGREHLVEIAGQNYSVTIYDMYSGVDISGNNVRSAFNFLDETLLLDPARRELLTIFKNRLQDYIDFDDNLQINGMERMDYETANLSPLPRNAAVQYREELLWIPGSEEFINSDADGVLRYINLIPPRGMATSAPRPSLLGASPELLRDMGNLDDREIEAALQCLEQLKNENITLDEAFASQTDLLVKLKAKFSVTESGFYTIIIRPGVDNPFGGRTLAASLRIDATPPQLGYKFYQWQFY